tara:strand:+ start:493 stop:633 length:141 start_codon:yes stop_codon:yes gene_type:complete
LGKVLGLEKGRESEETERESEMERAREWEMGMVLEWARCFRSRVQR